MLKINELLINNCKELKFLDEKPTIGFSFESDKNNNKIKKVLVKVNDWEKEIESQIVHYDGPLEPFTKYEVSIEATDIYGEVAKANTSFETLKVLTPFQGKWITDGTYEFKGKASPKVMLFRKNLEKKNAKRVLILSTALGWYFLKINGKRIDNDYFNPGFTTYKEQLQYQAFDITEYAKDDIKLDAYVAGGWAVGSFTYGRYNKITANRQALKLEVRYEYEDGSVEIIPSDESWLVTTDTEFEVADLYDGESFDARKEASSFHNASIEKPKTEPKKLLYQYGEVVRLHEEFNPISINKSPKGELIYDFGQNFSGVVELKIKNGKAGEKVIIHHAEVLFKDELCLRLLRSAKATIEYTMKDGEQTYIPSFTYMGFRYIGVTGVEKDDIEIKAHAIYSTVNEIGKFECSNQDINKLQQNICWSAKSNFVDIPTDCPQRDERMGWTGDIGLFSETACYNFDVKRFLEKWLKDMRVEQNKGGGFPNIIPSHGYGFPLTMPHVACDYWGDACIFVPLALYYQTGDIKLLEDNYEMMKKYNKACLGWANMLSFGKHRYIWHTLNMIHFGDWVVPGVDSMAEWQKRHKWTATCSLANTSRLLSKIAKILGKEEDSIYYNDLFLKVSDAFESILTDGAGKIKYEFETAYVLSLAHGMFKEENKENALNNLIKIIEKDDYTVHTGFPGTPFILFALADNGREDIAYKMLLNEKCPGWLFEVKAGGTTTWERWDALKADGSLNFANEDGTGGMVSFNHYALGAVGNFLYTRVLGLEALTGGYETFRFKPILGGDLKYAKGETKTPYGIIKAEWKIDNKKLTMSISAPFGTSGEITLPIGKVENIGSGDYSFSVDL